MMGEVTTLLQQLVTSFEAFLSQAQAAGQVEKYVMEVVVGKIESQSVLHSSLYASLVNILLKLQELLEKCYTKKIRKSATSQYEHMECSPDLTEPIIEDKPRCKTSIAIPQSLHRLSPPLQPTTKETEAANVLMNLSGKAAPATPADQTTQTIVVKSCPTISLHTHHSCSMPPTRKDGTGKREVTPCDEVPQINEKDLLPLATQVLCQFCSLQCEDLVELHEHVLASHHAAEVDHTLSTPQQKPRPPLRLDEEGGVGLVSMKENQKKDQNDDCEAPVIVLLQQPEDSHSSAEKKTKQKGKPKKESRGGKLDSMDDWQSPVASDSPETTQIKPSSPPTAVQTSTDNISFKDQDWLKEQENRSVIELTPVAGGDPLAMAVESSRIPLLESKNKIMVLVCLSCSSGFTDPQEHSSHLCPADRPLVSRAPDGTVTLADLPPDAPSPQNLQGADTRLFPESFIQQTSEEGSQGLQVVHISGRTLHLHTTCPLSYLADQLILFWCPICQNDCEGLSQFLDHLTNGPCMFRCPDCQLVYISVDNLKKHRESLHPSLEDRTCPKCHHVFEKRHQRNKHLKTKCSQRHECVVCNRVLKNEYNLRVHMQTHEEKRKHVCKECGASFHRQAILTRHMMIHSGTKPHACPQCDSHFYTRQHLSTHLDRHKGLRRFPCSTCSRAYYSKHDRDTHYSKAHSKPQSIKSSSGTNVKFENVTE